MKRSLTLLTVLVSLGHVASAPHNVATAIFLVAVIGGIAVGLATGGSVDQIFSVRFRGVWFLLFLLFVSIDLWVASFLTDAREILYGFYIAQLLLVGVWLAYNAVFQLTRGLRFGLAVAGIGWILNLTVILLNGGMPVEPHLDEHNPDAVVDEIVHVESYRTVALGDDTVFPWLADVVEVPSTMQIVSLGDILLTLGLATFAGFAPHAPRNVESGGLGSAPPGHQLRTDQQNSA